MPSPAKILRTIANTSRLHPKNEKALHAVAKEIERLDNARMAALHALREAQKADTSDAWSEKALEILEAAEPQQKVTMPDLTNEQLAAAVAEEVMGWRLSSETHWSGPPDNRNSYKAWENKTGSRDTGWCCGAASGKGNFRPDRDIAAAWEVHQAVQKRLFSVRQRYYVEIQWAVHRRTDMAGLPSWPCVFGLLEPADICHAALKAVRVNRLEAVAAKDAD